MLINGRPLAIPRIVERAGPPSWKRGTSARKAARRSARCSSATSIPAANCRSVFPRSVGQLPVYYNRRADLVPAVSRFEPREPLWAFGHGLSYTTFTIANVRVSPASIGAAGRATVTVDVTNTGTRAGDEVVQLYIHDVVSSVTTPVKQLRGFERVTLAPGKRRR